MIPILIEPYLGDHAIVPHPRDVLTGKGGLNMDLKPREGAFDIFMAFIKKITKQLLKGNTNLSAM